MAVKAQFSKCKNIKEQVESIKDKSDILNYLIKGALKDKYVTPEDGSPSYRSYEKVPSIYEYLDKEDADIALSLIYECQHFYRHGLEENNFGCTMALGVGSPNSNKKEVDIV